MSSLNELPEFRYDPDNEIMYRKNYGGWKELGCMECDWSMNYPENTVAVLSVDE